MKTVAALCAGAALMAVSARPVVAQSAVPAAVVVQPAAVAVPAPIDQRSLTLAREILDITNPPAEREKVLKDRFRAIVNRAMATADAQADPKAKADFEAGQSKAWDGLAELVSKNLPSYYEAYARAYTRQFSVAELQQIRDFALTPAGRRFVSIGSVIYKDPEVQAAQQHLMAETITNATALKAEQHKQGSAQ